jgi:small multidrug resistance pump
MSVETITNRNSTEPQIPRWIPRVLYAAAIYNLAWGLFIVLFPLIPFRWAGMQPPNYPAIVQCLGMVIGVYGIGYAIAARDPVTQWPLVLVGLLGKIFGPIGFVYAVAIGEFPWWCGLNILTNDLIWWLPFIAIILYAIRVQDARQNSTGLTLAARGERCCL